MSGRSKRKEPARERRERQCRSMSQYGQYSGQYSGSESSVADLGLASVKEGETHLLESSERVPRGACATGKDDDSIKLLSSMSDVVSESVASREDSVSTVRDRESSEVRVKPRDCSVRSERRMSRKSSVGRRESRREGSGTRRSAGASVRPTPRASSVRSVSEEENVDSESYESGSDVESASDIDDQIAGRDVRRLIKSFVLSVSDQHVSRQHERANREVQSIVSYRDSDEIHHYIMGLEADLLDLEIPRKRWKRILLRKLTPKARKAVRGVVSEGECTYDALKRALIKKLGLSRAAVTDKLFGTSQREFRGMDHVARFQMLRDMMDRLVLSCDSAKDVPLAVVTGLFRNTLYPSERCLLESKQTGSYEDLNDVAETLRSGTRTRDSHERGKPRFDSHKGSREGSEAVKCYKCQGYGHMAAECRRGERSAHVTCFVCNTQGHMAFDCPNRADRVSKKDEGKVDDKSASTKRHTSRSQAVASSENELYEFKGKCNGRWCMFLQDSGAVMSMVSRDLVDPTHFTGEYKVLVLADGKSIRRPLAKVRFELCGEVFDQVVAVSNQGERESFVFLSSPPEDEGAALSALKSLCEREARRHTMLTGQEAPLLDPPVSASAVVTRSEFKRAVSQAVEQTKSSDVPLLLVEPGVTAPSAAPAGEVESEVVQTSQESEGPERWDVSVSIGPTIEGSVGEDVNIVCEEERVLEKKDEECVSDVVKDGSAEECVLVSFGCPSNVVRSEVELLRKQVEDDDTLRVCRELAGQHANGYTWDNNMLFHVLVDASGDERRRLVLPVNRRAEVLRLAHDNNGHVGVKAMRVLLNRRFSWPGLGKDVVKYVSECEVCLKHNRAGNVAVKMVERPVISVPFDSVAFDLVGPLPKARGGIKYVLTYICLASRWPEAVALRSVTADSVANGMCAIIFRTGIPSRILSDRGTVFLSKVVGRMCEILGCDQIRSSPYRPQSNGMLERFHGTLKPMLGKAKEKGVDWSDFLPMALYAIRQVPCRSTGYSPHELVYGRSMCGPLDLLYSGWVEDVYQGMDVSEWVVSLQDKLALLHDLATAHELKVNANRAEVFNRHKSDREYSVGDQVLVRIPGLHLALSGSWEGPYTICDKISRVTYRLKREGSEHVRLAHINNLKTYNQREISKYLAGISVVAEEDECMSEWEGKSLLGDEYCEEYCEEDIVRLVSEHGECFSEMPGLCESGECKIVLSEGAKVVNIPPRNLPVHIREKVEVEIRKLLDADIIEECDEEWSSPIVPIKKKDGTIRLCVDYREVNAQTPLRRFWLPSLREIMDKVGPSAVLSKLDLTAGFHQVKMEEGSKKYTTFSCPLGKFWFKRMPFGLKNAPAIFQSIIERVLRPVSDVSCNYIDDVVVYSESWEKHVSDLSSVLRVLSEAGLKVKWKKCEFGRKSMSYLGHQIGSGCIGIPEARVRAMREYRKPITRKQLRAFLGSIGYYRDFIPNFADHSCHLTPATSLTAPRMIAWSEQMTRAFGELKSLLCNACVLFIPQKQDQLKIYTDASGGGIGGCLHVVRGIKELPVAFYSRQLRGPEQRYSVTELESLAIVETVRHFDYYVSGAHVDVVTDHRACVALMASSHLNKRLMRMALKLQDYDVSISYRPGRMNGNADGLSCQDYDIEEEANQGLPVQEVSQPSRKMRQGLAGGPVGPASPETEEKPKKKEKKKREEKDEK